MKIEPVAITAYTLTSALGAGLESLRSALGRAESGLSPASWPGCDVKTWLGEVKELRDATVEVGAAWESRNNRLALLGLQQDGFSGRVREIAQRFGADRVGVVMGTSTSSVGRTEAGFRHLDAQDRWPARYAQPQTHHPHSPGAFVAAQLGVEGPAMTISTACSSSARVFASAARWLRADLVDAVVVGGVDSLCLSTIYGFHSLQLVAPERCRPFDQNRQGLNLGEAAGYALMMSAERAPDVAAMLVGYGESCDAYHMSSAHPDGLGARRALTRALERADRVATDIDYLNLHGTGTPANDRIEGMLCASMFPVGTVMSGTKAWTGHTLGAAGIVEAVISLEALRSGMVPGTLGCDQAMPEMADRLALENRSVPLRRVMSSSFGFGGNNCALIFEAAA